MQIRRIQNPFVPTVSAVALCEGWVYRGMLILSIFLTSCIAAQPKISVLCFINNEQQIGNVFENLSCQTIFNECELILISTRYSELMDLIVTNYLYQYTNIQYIPHLCVNNQTTLLNYALQKAKGTYITIITPEDSLNPEIFEKYLKALEENNSLDLVYADAFIRYEQNTNFQEAADSNWYSTHKGEFSPTLLFYNLPGTQCMWRKSLHEKYGYFDESFTFFGTLEFYNRIVSKGSQFKKIEGKSGISYLPYCDAKKLFNSLEDNEKGYQEMKTIKKNYNQLWQTKSQEKEELPFVIIIPSYKNKEWYKRNLDSVFNQFYTNYRIIYIDDAAPDGTGSLVEQHTKECQQEHKMTLIKNNERVGALANIYKAVYMCNPEEIVVLVDGDDWLAHENVLTYLNDVYHDPKVWITYGQFVWFPAGKEGFAWKINNQTIAENSFRYSAWSATHLRTFYAGLFQKIKPRDLLYENNKFYTMCWDLSIMYPMIEMAGGHSHFVPDILYVYNNENSINDHKVNIDLQGAMGKHILNRPRYEPIAALF